MLDISGLSFAYGSKPIFDKLSLHVAAGDHVVIVGDSGGGKSTLLNLIADHHEAITLSEDATSSMVLQDGALLDHLNVIDNLKLVARFAKRKIELSQIEAILTTLNVEPSLHNAAISQLSGGQTRRVAIARALISHPDLVMFDEPDAGLDIANLISLSDTVNGLIADPSKACLTVSHNPFYIARVATKVYRLQGQQLVLIADWPKSTAQSELQERQRYLQAELSIVSEQSAKQADTPHRADWPVLSWLIGLVFTVGSLFQLPRSPRDALHIAAYTSYLSLITGIVFFALVGLMLGATTMAVVKMLSDNALSGWVGIFVKPESLVSMMGGRYVLYLAPSIGGMLFAARSGSIVSNWLGEMTRSRQVRALKLLGVSPQQYLAAPAVLALFISMLVAISWFAFCVWAGGVLTAHHLFDLANTNAVMALTEYDLKKSLIVTKTVIYSVLVALTVVSLGLAPKTTAHQLNIHTTKTIIYSTLAISLAELVIILT